MNETIKRVLDIMALVGIPSLFVCVGWFFSKVTQFGKMMRILMNAVQKQMKRDLMEDYHKHMNAGYIDDDDLDMWEASYQAYHALGENGIMDSRRTDLIKLNALSNKG